MPSEQADQRFEPGIDILAEALAGDSWTVLNETNRDLVRDGAQQLLHRVDEARGR